MMTISCVLEKQSKKSASKAEHGVKFGHDPNRKSQRGLKIER